MFKKRTPFIRTRSKTRAVYTCMFGYSEALNDFPIEADAGTDLLCFTDDPDLTSTLWRVIYVPYPMLDPVRASKRMKILAHRFLSDYDCSLYIDNTVRLKHPVDDIFGRYLDRSHAPLVLFRHPARNCVYDEAKAVIEAGHDDPVRVEAQMAHYRAAGHPEQAGLFKCAFLLRRHNDPELARLMECWFEQVLRYSFRDQLSFSVVTRSLGFSCATIPGDFNSSDLLEWPVVSGERVPRDFDNSRYLSLHPDVKIAGADPRRHYMLHGRAEGRAYK